MASGAAIKAGKAVIELALDSSALTRQLNGIRRRFQNLARNLTAIGTAITGFGLALSVPFVKAIKDAGDFAEALNLFEVIYGDLAAAQRVWLEDLAQLTRRSSADLITIAAQFGVIGKSIGLAGDDLVKFSRNLTERTIDIASLRNLGDVETSLRIASGIRGEVRAIEQLGIIIPKTRIEAALLEEGLKFTDATEGQKQLVRFNEILSQSTDAQGDAIRTADSFNNSMKGLAAVIKDTRIEIGNALLPAVSEFINFLRKAAGPLKEFAKDNSDLVIQAAAATVGIIAFGGALVILGGALAGVAAAISILTAVLGGLTSPVLIATGALVAMSNAFSESDESTASLSNTFKDLIADVDLFRTAIENGKWDLLGQLIGLQLRKGFQGELNKISAFLRTLSQGLIVEGTFAEKVAENLKLIEENQTGISFDTQIGNIRRILALDAKRDEIEKRRSDRAKKRKLDADKEKEQAKFGIALAEAGEFDFDREFAPQQDEQIIAFRKEQERLKKEQDTLAKRKREEAEGIRFQLRPVERVRAELDRIRELIQEGFLPQEFLKEAALEARNELRGLLGVTGPSSEARLASVNLTRAFGAVTVNQIDKQQLREQKDIKREIENTNRLLAVGGNWR